MIQHEFNRWTTRTLLELVPMVLAEGLGTARDRATLQRWLKEHGDEGGNLTIIGPARAPGATMNMHGGGNQMIGQAAATPRKSEIAAGITMIRDWTERTNQAIQDLEAALDVVLMPDSPPAGMSAKESGPMMSGLGNELGRIQAEIQMLHNRLVVLRGRVVL